jgi:shikimate kinase
LTVDVLPNLVLVGFMGTGKSTVGQLAAQRLQWTHIDTDEMIEQETGLTIPQIFAGEGEETFRALERDICKRVSTLRYVVISTGGGMIVDPDNREALEECGVVILLKCDRDVLLRRMSDMIQRKSRPLVESDLELRVDSLLAERGAVYASVPLQVDTTYLTPGEVLEQVMNLYAGAARDKMSPCTL